MLLTLSIKWISFGKWFVLQLARPWCKFQLNSIMNKRRTKKENLWRVFHRQVEFFCVMVSDCKNLLAILFVARALNQSKSNWFNFLICKKNVLCTEQRTLNTFITFSVCFFVVFFCSHIRLFFVLCAVRITQLQAISFRILRYRGADIIFPFHSNNLSFSIFRLLDLTFLLLFTSSIRENSTLQI